MRTLACGAWLLAFALTACATGPERYDRFDTINSLAEYRGAPLPPALGSCEVLLPQLASWRRLEHFRDDASHRERIEQYSTREAAVRIISFDESYANGRIQAALTEPLDFATDVSDRDANSPSYLFVRVPTGFVTDFNSAPSGPAQAFHRTFGRTAIPAIVHDFLYGVGVNGDDAGRQRADTALRRGLDDNNTRQLNRRIVYWAVQAGGGNSYGASRELRLYDMTRTAEGQRRIVALSDADRLRLRDRYVRLCPETP